MPRHHVPARSALLQSFLGLTLCAAAALVLAQTSPPTPAVVNPQPAPASTAPNGVTQAAVQQGALSCAARINQVSSFVTGSNPSNGQLLTGPQDRVNKDIVATAIEVEGSGITSLVTSSYAPGAGASECSATYDAITYWNASCAMVATSNYGAYKLTPPLMRSVYVLDGGPTVKVFLMPAGSGCVSVKKEMVY